MHSGTKHARRRVFASNSLDGTIPAALSALMLLQILCARPADMLSFLCARPARAMPRRAAACERSGALVSVSAPACARTHRRTAVRVPSPHVAASTPAAPPQWPSAAGYSVSFAVFLRVLVLC